MAMCDPDPVTLNCRNDGAWNTTNPPGEAYTFVENISVTNSDGSHGYLLDPYLTLAKQYGWANFMYQTNQGGSYTAHQYIFSGTSAMTAEGDANSTFIAENFLTSYTGCQAPQNATTYLIAPLLSGAPSANCNVYDRGSVQECPITNTALVYPSDPVGTFCFPHQSMPDLLDPKGITWKYYAPGLPIAEDLWIAPNSIQSLCQPAFVDPSGNPNSAVQCAGQEYNARVDVNNRGTDILRDIANCNLQRVSWVIPDAQWSDHATVDNNYGPSWVATVINSIGNNPTCAQGTPDAGQNYWQNTAIIVTWDDWGGWSDNQPPPYISQLPCRSTDCQGDFQYGFRVPFMVVSAYTPAGYIDNTPHDFGSILRFIEGVYDIPEGALGFADRRSDTDLQNFFTLPSARTYQTIPVQVGASYFLSVSGEPAVAPDDD
jgi:phospholipase C